MEALPKIALVKNYCKRNFVSKGMIADISFHDLDGHNPHAHVMLTLREITPQGFGNKNRSWNEHDLMDEWRASWSRMSNRALERAGSKSRMDYRSLAAQREEAITLSKAAQEAGRLDIANEQLAKAVELNRPALTRINRKAWHTRRAKGLRAAEQVQAAQAKQAADDFRQLFKSDLGDLGHLMTVNLNSFRIETVKTKTSPQHPIQRSPEPVRQPVLVVPERKRRFKPVEAKQKDMSLYYGVAPKTEKPTLLRRKRRNKLHKLYDFIKSFMSVLVKRTVHEPGKPVSSTAASTVVSVPLQDAKILTDTSLDEIMIDPVTKLKITRRQWNAMGTTSKSADVSVPPDANYNHEHEKKQEPDKTSRPVAFPPLQKEKKVSIKSVGFTLPKIRFGSRKRKDE